MRVNVLMCGFGKKYREPDWTQRSLFAEAKSSGSVWGFLDRSRPILADLIARGWAQRELDACAKMNVHLLTCEDADYPNSLFDLKDPPLLLYLWA
jgi:Predicted Rossmann fold nucleotide-binding protein involved in DNA uptake